MGRKIAGLFYIPEWKRIKSYFVEELYTYMAFSSNNSFTCVSVDNIVIYDWCRLQSVNRALPEWRNIIDKINAQSSNDDTLLMTLHEYDSTNIKYLM